MGGQVLHSKTAYQLFCDISTHRAYTLYLSGSKTCDDRVEVTEEGKIEVFVTINIAYGYAIPAVSGNVQEKVKAAIENMTGLEVSGVNVRIADVDMKSAVE